MVARLCDRIAAIQATTRTLPASARANLVFERDLPASKRGGVEAGEVAEAIFIIGDPSTFDPVFIELLRHAAVLETARELLGIGALVAHFMNVTIKHPRFGRAIGWHRDYPNAYICPESSAFLRLMICLDGMEASMGATRFIAGSHRISDERARQEKVRGGWPQPAELAGEAAECGEGAIVAIHPKVLHGGGINQNRRIRRNVVLQVGVATAALVTTETESITGTPLELQ